MPSEKTNKRLEALLQAFDSGAVQSSELIQAIDAVMAIIDQNGKTLVDKILETKSASDSDISGLRSELSKTRDNLQTVINQVKGDSDTSVSSVKKALLSEIKRVEGLIPVLPPETDLTDVFQEFETMRGELGNLSVLIAGENIRNALESLQGDERLDKSAIKGLDELIEDITRLSKSNRPQSVGTRLLRYLSDVSIEGITNGQILVWNSTTSRFEAGNNSGGGGGGVSSVVAGTGITVDDTDPANPIINATPSAGGITEELAIAYAVSL